MAALAVAGFTTDVATSPSPAAAAIPGEWTFTFTGKQPQYFTVKPGMKHLTMQVVGGAGAFPNDEVGRGGISGMVIANFSVHPGEDLTIWVGGHGTGSGGWGWGCGGAHGHAHGVGKDGGGGGGASAVSVGKWTGPSDCGHRPADSTLLAVAGGGGGGGGNGYGGRYFNRNPSKPYCMPQQGGTGGDDEGTKPGNGEAGEAADCYSANNGGKGGAAGHADGNNGHSSAVLSGAGGGGGGGYRGGAAGCGGQGCNGSPGGIYIGAAGGGGGAGSSYLPTSAANPYYLPGNGAGDGEVILTNGVAQVFTCTKHEQTVTVPDQMSLMIMQVTGGHGGGRGGNAHIAAGGGGGYVGGDVSVKPGQQVHVWVGCYGSGHGGWGWSKGHEHGEGDEAGRDGDGGGGSSAVAIDNKLVVAGGGGGGGGDGGSGSAGRGGNAGTKKPQHGQDAAHAQGGKGGCFGCNSGHNGSRGHNAAAQSDSGGGGGGGGGWHGGGGGRNGELQGLDGGRGGGGGGAGSSYTRWGGPGTIKLEPQATSQTPNGLVVLTFIPGPSAVAVHGGSKQHAVLGSQFVSPLEALVTNRFGTPLAGYTVKFDLSSTTGGGTFPGGKTTATATTDSNGVATSPKITASKNPGAWNPAASLPEVASAAKASYQLYNDRYPTRVQPGVSPGSPMWHQALTLTATANSAAGTGTPTGTVEFYLDWNQKTPLPPVATTALDGSGKASVSYDPPTPLAVGKHTLKAFYQGDVTHAPSNVTIGFTVTKAQTTLTLTSSPDPSGSGDQVTFIATVHVPGGTPPPQGQPVTFRVDNLIDTVPVGADGTASFTTPGLDNGSHPVTADLAGGDDYENAHAVTAQNVGPGATAVIVTASANPAVYGDPPTLTATVAPPAGNVDTPGGTVGFTTPTGITLCTAELVTTDDVTAGSCKPSPTALDPGATDITATYNGDNHFTTSLGGITQVVTKMPATVSVSFAPDTLLPYGSQYTLTAQVHTNGGVAPPLSGQMWFEINNLPFFEHIPVTDGHAVTTGVTLPGGPATVTGVFAGNTFVQPSTGSTSSYAVPAGTTLTLTSSRNPALPTDQLTLLAAVSNTDTSPPPEGAVQFRVDGLDAGAPVTLSGGNTHAKSAPIGPLPPGVHHLTAVYIPLTGLDWQGSQDTIVEDVQHVTHTDVGSPDNPAQYGQPVTFRANVTPIPDPGGTMDFTLAGKPVPGCQNVQVDDGSAACRIDKIEQTSVLHASYSGTDLYTASAGDLTQTIVAAATTTTLSSNANPAAAGQPVTVTATVGSGPPNAGTPAGSVQFSVDGQNLGGPVPLDPGHARATLTGLTAGRHTITAAFVGTGHYADSSGTLTQNVTDGNGDFHDLAYTGEPVVPLSVLAGLVLAAGAALLLAGRRRRST